MSVLTQAELKSLLHYDPGTGKFYWLVTRGKAKAGGLAGNKNQRGYIGIGLIGADYQAHRLAFLYMTGAFPSDQCDHINGARDDNRWANLRAVSGAENKRNQKTPSNSKTGVLGVCWYKRVGAWQAQIQANGRNHYLGCFANLADAIAARKAAEVKYGFHPNHGRSA